MADVLTLGGFTFDDFSTPTDMMGGGKQAMVVHKLPGGSRVIDTLGPDEDEIVWSGFFYGNNAYSDALTLDAMRAAGQVIPLTWGGQFRMVIIQHFVYKAKRLPVWLTYSINCMVYQNPGLGAIGTGTGGGSIDALVSADLSFSVSIGQQ